MLTFKDNFEDQVNHLVEFAKSRMPSGVRVRCDGYTLEFEVTVTQWLSVRAERHMFAIPIGGPDVWYRWKKNDNRGALLHMENQIELTRQKILDLLK